MPRVPINNSQQYEKAIEVLTDVGGTWQGVGQKERFLLVTEAQYQALVAAKVVQPNHTGKDANGASKPKKKT